MVRIIPVHNFPSQNVGQIEESTASCTANIMNQDVLLTSLSSHCVIVYNLETSQSTLLTTFPTVDLVNKIIHCDKGNYVATLESKLSRDGILMSNFVRIYINWIMNDGNEYQPMRARIAGRVTPSLNRHENNLEMIELPLNNNPTDIACCQTTGNLLVAMNNIGIIYELKVETQQTSKLKFFDFEVRPWSLKFSFIPNFMSLAEDFICIMNNNNFILIRLTNQFHDDINDIDDNIVKYNRTLINCHGIDDNKYDFNSMDDDKKKKISNIDFNKSINDERLYIDWDELIINELSEIQRLKSLNLIDPHLKDFTVTLPSIQQYNNVEKYKFHDLPIVNAPDISIKIVTVSSNECGWSENYIVQHLLRLKIAETEQSTGKNNEIEYFTCCTMKPSYNREKLINSDVKTSLLRSKMYKIFNGITCFISTTQEGYLYHFSSQSTEVMQLNITNCQIYPFTAMISHVALENTALHAFTDAGLESYTLKIPNYIEKPIVNDYERIDDINDNDPVSLIGLRPFLGIKKMLQATKCLVLLASDDDSWTFYSLTLPKPNDIYHDILDTANNHKINSPPTYKHLLHEGHSVLQFSKNMIYYTSYEGFIDNIDDNLILNLDNLYRESCALLGDYYISSELSSYWQLSTYYYKCAGLKCHVVLGRDGVNSSPGLVTYLSDSLLNIKSDSDADALFQQHNIVDMLVNSEKNNLIKLILMCPVLREYTTDKLINIISNWQLNDMTRLALSLLYTQAGRQCQAENIIEPINNSFIIDKTLNNWSWLFDIANLHKGQNTMPTFSDFSAILMRQKLTSFSEILTKIVQRNAISLNEMIQIFLAYLPSRVGRDGRIAADALQLFLETYLKYYYNNLHNNQLNNDNIAIIEGFKILVRSYLADLSQTNCEKYHHINDNNINNSDILFENLRPCYLDYSLLYINDNEQLITNDSNGFDNTDDKINKCKDIIIRLELRKLQALLSCEYLPIECYHEVQHFINKQNTIGSLSLNILCAKTTDDAIKLLADKCPQALLEYAKSKYTTECEWKCFIEFLVSKMTEDQCNDEIHKIYDELLKNCSIYVAQTLSMKCLQKILTSDILPNSQCYIDISNQIIHADYIKTMIVGTGQHLLCNINS